MLVTSSCAGTVSRGSEPGATHPKESFTKALEVCRFWRGGRVDQRSQIPPTDTGIAACLKRRGWNPDGLPADLLDHLSGLGQLPTATSPVQE
jgi:hypothetical protein